MTRAALKSRWITFLTGAILLLLGATATRSQSVPEIAKEAFGSTVLLVMEDANGQPLSLGRGFFVRHNDTN